MAGFVKAGLNGSTKVCAHGCVEGGVARTHAPTHALSLVSDHRSLSACLVVLFFGGVFWDAFVPEPKRL